MESLPQLRKKTEQLLTSQQERVTVQDLSLEALKKAAQDEVRSAHGVLITHHLGLTDVMRKFIKPVLNWFHAWNSKADDLVLRVKEKSEAFNPAEMANRESLVKKDQDNAIAEIQKRYDDNELGVAFRDAEDAEKLYETMRKANGGKQPSRSPWWYFPFLMIIGAAEWLINYETFNQKYSVEAMAIGMTLLVALSFAAASHFHGEFLKQRVALIGKHIELPKRVTWVLFQLVSTVLLVVSITAVIIVRYQVIQDGMSQVGSGISLPGATPLQVQSAAELLMPTIFLNLAVYLLGFVISYAVHDSVPGYQRAKKDMERAREEYEAIKAKMQKEKNGVIEQTKSKLAEIAAAYADDTNESRESLELLKQIERAQESVKKAVLLDINRFVASYKAALLSVARAEADSLRIGPDALSLDEYQKSDIKITAGDLDAL